MQAEREMLAPRELEHVRAVVARTAAEIRQQLTEPAARAVEAGLACATDSASAIRVKAGTLGARVLQGVGVLDQESNVPRATQPLFALPPGTQVSFSLQRGEQIAKLDATTPAPGTPSAGSLDNSKP